MRPLRLFRQSSLLAVPGVLALLASCSSDDSSSPPTGSPTTGGVQSTTGGRAATGGVATGGNRPTGGSATTGGNASGGNTSGGNTSGGAGTTGGNAGGAGTATGGSSGAPGSGGASGGVSGGASAGGGAGGQPSTGGGGGTTAGAGGSATAGASGSGGSGGGSSSSFAPCPAMGECKILPLGDSITDGFNIPGGYRIELYSQALEAGKSITFVGSKSNGPAMVDGKSFPQNHEGYSGWTIVQIDDDKVPSPALDPDPHIVLLHIGTNDMRLMPNGAPDRLEKLIDEILTALPDSLLVVSNIIPFPAYENQVASYNAAIPEIVEERATAGKHILFVDQFDGFPENELADTVHPNQAGYARMAAAWYEAIEPYLR